MTIHRDFHILYIQFGSSECGQCAHGGRAVSDIVVTVPRVVYSLRGKNVCNIACGALHNVAVTSEGRVSQVRCASCVFLHGFVWMHYAGVAD